MTKPTKRQQKILDAMRNGSRLILTHGINPWASLSPAIANLRIRANDPWNMERKGLIEVSRQEWNFTEYKIKEGLQ